MKKSKRLLALVIFFTIFVFSGCKDQSKKAKFLTEVDIITLKTSPLEIISKFPGRVSAYKISEVRPQITGIILKRNFNEGSYVQSGVSLYQINPAPYQSAYNHAYGNFKKAQAAKNIADLTVKRYKSLINKKQQYISQQDYDLALADSIQANAILEAAQAELEEAKINLTYTKVLAPIKGYIGKSSVTEGALVTQNQNAPLASIQQLDPIYIDIVQSTSDFLKLKQELADGTLQQKNGKMEVTLILENGQIYPQKGTVEFSDLTVDPSTSSITIRTVFPNPKIHLLPGMFVQANLNEGTMHEALLVPQQAINRNPRGEATAFIVNTKNQVELRTINATKAIGDKWLVTGGLNVGDKVIINGLQRIRPGVTVAFKEITYESTVGNH